MPRFLCWLLAFGFLFSSAVALPGMLVAANIRSAFSSSTSLRRASLDPFYTAPTGYEKKSPGTILRFRPAPGNATSLISNCSAIYNILFRTTNSHYQPSWAVTTVFVPLDISQNETNHKNRPPLLSYQVPYNTDDNDFSPSLLLYETALPSDISAALGRGWYVNVPDFEGTLASFTAGVQEGHATLDSVRAALSAGLGVDFKSRYALWGYSGGSIASEWAAELQVQYAPELNFSGMAIGGLVPVVENMIPVINSAPYAGLIPLSLLGLGNQWPELSDYLLSRLKINGQYNRTGFLAAKTMSTNEAFATYALQDIYQYFINGKSDLEARVLRKILNTDGTMGYHGVPQMPMFVYKAIADEASLIGDTDVLVQRYCAVGANILYQRNTVGVHISEFTNGVGRSFEWLDSVFSGTYVAKYSPEGCTVQNVTVGVA